MTNEVDPRQLTEQSLTKAKERGGDVVSPNGLLNQLTKNVLETVLEASDERALGMRQTRPGRM
nr:hypothetical protein [Phytoactinopolyspora endophytica]